MQVNVYGLLHLAHSFAPLLKRNGNGGCLCQINSLASLRGLAPSYMPCSASKAASFSVTQALQRSLQDQHTMVVSVHPGPIATDLLASLGDEYRSMGTPPEDAAKAICASIEAGDFLCFPDPKSKELYQHYQPFATHVFDKGNGY